MPVCNLCFVVGFFFFFFFFLLLLLLLYFFGAFYMNGCLRYLLCGFLFWGILSMIVFFEYLCLLLVVLFFGVFSDMSVGRLRVVAMSLLILIDALLMCCLCYLLLCGFCCRVISYDLWLWSALLRWFMCMAMSCLAWGFNLL